MKINQGNSRNIMNCNIFPAATKRPNFDAEWKNASATQPELKRKGYSAIR